jgi:hypothetical protein
MFASTSNHREKPLLLLELGTLLVLSILTMWSVYALLEEWGLFSAFNAQGVAYIKVFAGIIPLRPLHLVPTALFWELRHGHISGVAAGTLLLLVLRYVVARWAVSPLFRGYDRWAVATLAAVLVGWPGTWLGRFAPAQFSALFFFAAMGCAIRLQRRWSVWAALSCIFSILVLLGTYQALALCLVALPLFALMWSPPDPSRVKLGFFAAHRGEVRVALTIIAAFVLYGVYAMLVSRGPGGGGYEADLAHGSSRLLTVSGLATHIGHAYMTVFGAIPSLLPLFLLLAFYLVTRQPQSADTLQPAWASALVFGLIATLPLFSLIYVNDAHVHDPDRVMYPVAVAFVVVVASLMAWHRPAGASAPDKLRAIAVVGAVLLAGTVTAYNIKKYGTVQREVIKQAMAAVDAQHPKSLVIQDASGTLGDLYTLINPTLTQALAFYGRPVNATICTLAAVDRVHPDAQRFPIPTTPHCEDMPAQAAPVLVLVARKENDAITLRP